MNTNQYIVEYRKFGFILSGGFALLFGLLPFIQAKPMPVWPFIVSGICLFSAMLRPLWLKRIYQLWMKIGHILGWINTRLILGCIFFFLITPVGIVRRLLGKDTMQKAYDLKKTTYRRESQVHLPKQMEKPY